MYNYRVTTSLTSKLRPHFPVFLLSYYYSRNIKNARFTPFKNLCKRIEKASFNHGAKLNATLKTNLSAHVEMKKIYKTYIVLLEVARSHSPVMPYCLVRNRAFVLKNISYSLKVRL